ncbi:hypothetical protein WBG78_07405 [Chryseolinea sp. T2]|uniref:hypothetical protein n=1 Tax=Chryseolinea sp. T2 TaxID=3129255 RepID=UPI003076AFB0
MNTEKISNDIQSKIENINPYREEGKVAKAIEAQTSKLPSDAFLWLATGIMAASLTLKVLKKDHPALFIGQWVAPVLLMGLYNKLVKVKGHDQLNDLPS